MQTVREQATLIDISLNNGFKSPAFTVPDPKTQLNKLRISEFKSWSVCFAIICSLTGLLMYLRVGVTMETVTTSLFVLSCCGLVYSMGKMMRLSKSTAGLNDQSIQILN